MKVFISSLISGMEEIRTAAREAAATLRHEPVMAEDFGARPQSPQVACLTALRKSDVVALILGANYGAMQPSGLSATHEEYRTAKGVKPVIAFVQEGVSYEEKQSEFVREVQGWEGGLYRGGFRTASDLKIGLTRALHDYELANAVGPVDQDEIIKRALSFLPRESGNSSGNTAMNLVVAGGPRQSILRPIEIENPALADFLHQAALFGPNRLFDPSLGVDREIDDGVLVLRQNRGAAQISLNEQGSVLIRTPVRESGRSLPELIEEFLQKQLLQALAYSSGALDHIDPTQRITHIAAATSLSDADYMGWRTQRESEASPHSISIGGHGPHSPVHVSRPRAALRLDAQRTMEDLIVPLRRQWRS
jgi:Domain of unknown function (DUF4062)